jgi:hypothetical protein
MEIIGHLRPFGEPPSPDIHSRFYDNTGNTLDYVYELEGDTLIIWGGEKGSPAYYRGTFSPDGNSHSGEWVYPGGGGTRRPAPGSNPELRPPRPAGGRLARSARLGRFPAGDEPASTRSPPVVSHEGG